jgi:hypothetical protein
MSVKPISLSNRTFHDRSDKAVFSEMRKLLKASKVLESTRLANYNVGMSVDKQLVELIQDQFIPRLLENNQKVTENSAGDLLMFIEELFEDFQS